MVQWERSRGRERHGIRKDAEDIKNKKVQTPL
jgi:hypothetical protein